jgi:transcription antitermination factor NusG
VSIDVLDALEDLRSRESWEEIQKLTSDWDSKFKLKVWQSLQPEERSRIESWKPKFTKGDKVRIVDPDSFDVYKGTIIEYSQEKHVFLKALVEYKCFGKLKRSVICRLDWVSKI